MALRDTLLAEFDHELATTRRLLERLPEGDEALGWKPHVKSMSLGGLSTHLANIPSWTNVIMDQTFFDLESERHIEDQHTRAGVLAHFDRTATAARTAIEKTDAEFAAIWTLKRSGQEVFSMPRAAVFRSFVFNHLIHHRGQLSVYLRLRDIPVPPIYGPSADEGQ